MEISKAELKSAAAASAGSDSSELRGAEILVKALQAEGVKFVWGYPGAVFATMKPPSFTGPSMGFEGSSTPSVNLSTNTVPKHFSRLMDQHSFLRHKRRRLQPILS